MTRDDIRRLGNNLEDAVHDHSLQRRRHHAKLLRALRAYQSALRADGVTVAHVYIPDMETNSVRAVH